uniref:Uncharacterized protein n=1 Tax=Trichogramma kaykai TaxID=54128 RepID=A0ABD2VY35_9HYME
MANAPFNFEELARALMTVRPALPTFSGLDHDWAVGKTVRREARRQGTSSRLPAAEVSALCETSTRRDRGGQSRGDDRPAAPWITENGENLQRPKLRHAV